MKPSLRVLTISNCDLVESQGSGYVITHFARGLSARGHHVTLLSPQDCILWPGLAKARSLRLALGMRRAAQRQIREAAPDIVEFYGAEAWLATAYLSRQPNRRFKIVAHSNGLEPFVDETLRKHGIHNTANGRPPRWYQGKLRFPVEQAFNRADAIVTVSQAERDYALRRAFQPRADRVLAIDNALTEEFLGQAPDLSRPKVIGFCGSWIARKGNALIAADLTRVLREAPIWRLHLVGVGREFRACDHFPADVVERVVVTGFVTDKMELRRIYQSWAIALMPSVYESFGLVAAEAMASGCALVAARTGFASALIDGEEALLLPEAESPALRHAVMQLVVNESLRQRISQTGWKRVQNLRWSESIDQLETFYDVLVGGRP